jgi:hypothetical protein
MLPSIWGPNFWYVLHIITFSYPLNPSEYDKRAYHDFFTTVKDVIPCDICKKHYSKYIMEYPIGPHLDSKANLIKWLIQIHNFVNLSLDKPIYSNEEVMNIYSNLKPVSPFINIDEYEIAGRKKAKENYKLIIGLIILFTAIIFFIKKIYQVNYYYV